MDILRRALFRSLQNDERIFDFIQECAIDGLLVWEKDDRQHYWADTKLVRTLSKTSEPEQGKKSIDTFIHNAQFRAYCDTAVAHFLEGTLPSTGHVKTIEEGKSTSRLIVKSISVFDSETEKELVISGFQIDLETGGMPEWLTNTRLYTTFLNSNWLYVVGINAEGNYIYVNDYFCEFYALSRKDIIGQSSLIGVVPEDIEKCLYVGNLCFANPGTPNPVTLRKQSFNDGIKTTQWEFTGIADETGVVTELFCVGYDITQHVKVEEDLSVLVSNMQDVLFTISRDGIFTYVSPSWTTMYGYTVEETVGQPFTKFIHPDDFKVCYEALKVTAETGKPIPGGGRTPDFT